MYIHIYIPREKLCPHHSNTCLQTGSHYSPSELTNFLRYIDKSSESCLCWNICPIVPILCDSFDCFKRVFFAQIFSPVNMELNMFRKNYNDQTYSCPIVSRLSASWLPNWGPPGTLQTITAVLHWRASLELLGPSQQYHIEGHWHRM